MLLLFGRLGVGTCALGVDEANTQLSTTGTLAIAETGAGLDVFDTLAPGIAAFALLTRALPLSAAVLTVVLSLGRICGLRLGGWGGPHGARSPGLVH